MTKPTDTAIVPLGNRARLLTIIVSLVLGAAAGYMYDPGNGSVLSLTQAITGSPLLTAGIGCVALLLTILRRAANTLDADAEAAVDPDQRADLTAAGAGWRDFEHLLGWAAPSFGFAFALVKLVQPPSGVWVGLTLGGIVLFITGVYTALKYRHKLAGIRQSEQRARLDLERLDRANLLERFGRAKRLERPELWPRPRST